MLGKICIVFCMFVMAERLRAPDSNSGVSEQQSAGSRVVTPVSFTFGWDVKPLVPCVLYASTRSQ